MKEHKPDKFLVKTDDGFYLFALYVEEVGGVKKIDGYSVSGSIFEIPFYEHRDCYDTGTTKFEQEAYAHFYIKWDGAMHMTFGDEMPEQTRDGYIAIWDKEGIKKHAQMLGELYDWAMLKMKGLRGQSFGSV